MKSTIVFLALLVLASCTGDHISSVNVHDNLVQLTSDPRADAVLAALSVHLKVKNGGFDKILGLLTELVQNARETDHQNVLVWRKTEATCTISDFNYTEKNDFYSGNLAFAKNLIFEAKADIADAEFLLSSRKSHVEKLVTVAKSAKTDSDLEGKKCDQLREGFSHVKKAIKDAVEAVNEWEGQGAFVQQHIENVATAYAQVKSLKIIVPTNLVQKSGNDAKVKVRLQEWLENIRALVNGTDGKAAGLCKNRNVEFNALAKCVSGLKKDLHSDSLVVAEGVKYYRDLAKETSKTVNFLDDMVNKNAGLLKQNTEWCAVEKENFNKAHEAASKQITLFKEVREYFVEHYSEISAYIMNKYN